MAVNIDTYRATQNNENFTSGRPMEKDYGNLGSNMNSSINGNTNGNTNGGGALTPLMLSRTSY